MSYDFKTVEEAVTEYIRVLESAPNGWGQHIDRKGRQAHWLRLDIVCQFGEEEVDQEFSRQIKRIAR